MLARMRLVAFLAAMLTISSALGQSRVQAVEAPLRVSLCEVKGHPEEFLHKLVEFAATASHGSYTTSTSASRS